MIRVLVVDDSAFARKVMREVLTKAGMEVVGIARDGLEALEKIHELKPDVITLDLVMPNLDGLGVLAVLTAPDAPRVVVVSMAGEDSAMGIAALQAGAVGLVQKPTSLAIDRLYEVGAELAAAVSVAARARVARPVSKPPAPAAPDVPLNATRQVLVIGASTGGPQALTRVIQALPASFPLPVALVLHLPVGYTRPFAERINEEAALEVVEAATGTELKVGRVVVAQAGLHLRLLRTRSGVQALLDPRPSDSPHRPSVNVLFESAAEAYGAGVLGVVLTGMGDDGLVGARAIHAAGGLVLTESEQSCVVYGMPRSIDENGLSDGSVTIDRMAEEILRRM